MDSQSQIEANIGAVLGSYFSNSNDERRGRLGLHFDIGYNFNEKISAHVETKFWSLFPFGLGSDLIEDTQSLAVFNNTVFNSWHYLIKSKYSFVSKNENQQAVFFLAFGAGQ